MPSRMLMYAGRLYDKYIHANKKNIYSDTLVRLPIPKMIVFYNGRDQKAEETILRLSDAFEVRAVHGEREAHAEYDIEVRVRMMNINHGHNSELMSKCKPLKEYA